MRKSMFQRILYATDMTDNAIVASHYALRLSHEWNAHLTIVSVIPDEIEEMAANMSYDLAAHYDKDTLDAYNNKEADQSRAALVDRINTLCSKLKTQLGDCLVCPEVAIRIGDPVEQILLEAENDGSDLIIIGSVRHNLFDSLLFGNVTREVIEKSPVPVISIPLAESTASAERYADLVDPMLGIGKDDLKVCS